jgi:hypothetical protein
MSFRSSSVIVGALAVVLPTAFFAYQERAFAEWAANQKGGVCGMPVLAALGLAVLCAMLLSFIAVVLGAVAFRRLPSPRPLSRVAELSALSVPLVVGAACLLALTVGV